MRNDLARPARPARLCHYDRRVQGVLRWRAPHRAASPARGAPRRLPPGKGDRQGMELGGQPPPGLGAVGLGRLDARNDGHHTQPGPQRPHGRRPCEHERQRAVRVGLVPAVHPAVRQGRVRRRRRKVRGRPGRGKEARGGQDGRRPRRRRAARRRQEVQGHMQEAHGQGVPLEPRRAARHGRAGRVRQLDGRARRRVPRKGGDNAGCGGRHGRQRRRHGVRQHGQQQRHGRRIHARPGGRLQEPVRRVPSQRAGRGCSGRHAHPEADSAHAPRAARLARRAGARVRPARVALPRAAGRRVHRRARPVLPAADARGKDQRGRHGAHIRRHGPRGDDIEGAGPAPPKDRKARPAAAPRAGGEGDGVVAAGRPRDRRLARRGVGGRRLRHGARKGARRGRQARHTRPRGDKARGRARLLRVGRHTDEPRRKVLARGCGGPRHGQAVHRGHVRHAHRLRGGAVHAARRLVHRGGRDDHDRRRRRLGVQGRPADGRAKDHARVPHGACLGRRGQAARGAGQRRHAGRGKAGARVRRARHRAVPDRAHVQRRGPHRPVPGHDHGLVGRREKEAPAAARGHAAARL